MAEAEDIVSPGGCVGSEDEILPLVVRPPSSQHSVHVRRLDVRVEDGAGISASSVATNTAITVLDATLEAAAATALKLTPTSRHVGSPR